MQIEIGFWGVASNSFNNIKDIRIYKGSLVVSSFTVYNKRGIHDYYLDSSLYLL